LILAEFNRFDTLRRALGLDRAHALVLDLAERAAAIMPSADVAVAGRNLIEVTLSADATELAVAVDSLRQAVARPLTTECDAELFALTIGAALADTPDPLALVEAAEAALAAARREGSATATSVPLSPADAKLGQELRAAVHAGELFLQYQPKLHLRAQEVTSLEALMRWRHPERGLVLPGDFIPAAERSGAIKAMTIWTLRQVIDDQRIVAAGGHDLPIFINIAGGLLADGDFVEDACALVEASGAKLGFEITETSVIDDPHTAIQHLNRFAAIGVAISIDDYGAGLSSLAYLKQLPARELKIDKLFVTQLSSSHRDPLIVRSTIDLAHALEMEVVAEGVETPTSLALLSVMGCDMVQGFLISRPLSLAALLPYLRTAKHRELMEQSRRPFGRLTAARARA
jgi:EAL domain-containing protein (putative c-di-GMP-specific phosphodiesterase class I)